ncbi:MAG: SusC/RagA family TonB-linked outer membrane protein [Bacteroidota bacterium]|nr:SusC/RagA family TonB-linked outer membrane protein [Bacteroidota bacterium]
MTIKTKQWIQLIRTLLVLFIFNIIQLNGSMIVAQTSTYITLNKQNATIENVLNEIESQTAYRFLYNKQLVDVTQKVTIHCKKQTLQKVLSTIFERTGITFTINDKQIVLSKSPKKSVQAQTAQVKGIIQDQNGDPIIGATIHAEGDKTGTVSDANGEFSLNAPEQSTLTISYIGYISTTVKAKTGDYLHIKLIENEKRLDDVVVVGYSTIKAKELTSAVAHISSRDFLSIGSSNPIMQIQGKVAGVTISNPSAADPNSSASVQIRGVSSRNAGLQPLYVVDGIADVDIQNVNPNDIESIDILKDGAASAIYGTRGGNGVIVVTTKKAKRDGNANVTYNGYFSADKLINKPDLLTAEEFRTYRVPDGAPDYGASTDWFDEVTQIGLAKSHAVTISGGTQKFGYRATADYRDASGIDIRSSRKEYGGRIAITQGTPEDLLNFSITAAPRIVNRKSSDQSAIDIAIRTNPTYPVMDADNPTLYSDFTGKLPTGPNPVETLSLIDDGSETKLLDCNASASLNILSAINPKLTADGNNELNTKVTVSENIVDNFDYYYSPSTTSTNRFAGISGVASRGYSKAVNQSLEWIGTGRYTTGSHTFNGLIGYSYNYYVNSGLSAWNRNFASDALSYNNLGSGDNEALKDPTRVGMSSSKSDSKLIGFFGRVTYNYNLRYMATASLRYEGSSRFGANNKWGYFPAISAGWKISDEAFMKGITWIDNLKIRGDFGITGNQNIPNYKSLALYSTFGQTYYNGSYITVAGPNSNINPDLRWEKGINWNIGTDFSLLNNLITGSLNYYNRTQKDLVGNYDAPMPPNITPIIYANVGTMKNTGLEAETQLNLIKTSSLSYSIDIVGDMNDNKFMSFSNDVYKGKGYDDAAYLNLGDFGLSGVPIQRIVEGKRIGTFYLYSYAGIDDNGKWLVWNAARSKKIKIKDAVESDKQMVGNGLPRYKLSMNHSLRYKKWDLSLSFRGAFGFDVFNTQEYAFGLKNAQLGYNVFKSAYTTNAAIEDGLSKPTDYFLENGNYIKLDVATIGYTFNMTGSRLFSGLRIYATGHNLLTMKGYKGLDPDIFPVNGLTPGVLTGTNYYPSTIQTLIGIQVNFL